MDILNLLPSVYEKFILYTLIFARISTMLTTFILLHRDMITTRIILSLSSILSFYVLLLYPPKQFGYDYFSLQMLIQVMTQMFIGFVSALILNIVFEVFVALGQVISTQIGLSMASLIEPRLGMITSLTHFYVILISLIFLFLNGHLFILKVLVDSFVTLPLFYQFVSQHAMMDILNYSSIIFSGSIVLSITIIITILLTNIALAVVTKFAPQFNLFSIGINISLIIGLLLIYLTFSTLVDKGEYLIQNGLNFLQNTLLKLA